MHQYVWLRGTTFHKYHHNLATGHHHHKLHKHSHPLAEKQKYDPPPWILRLYNHSTDSHAWEELRRRGGRRSVGGGGRRHLAAVSSQSARFGGGEFPVGEVRQRRNRTSAGVGQHVRAAPESFSLRRAGDLGNKSGSRSHMTLRQSFSAYATI